MAGVRDRQVIRFEQIARSFIASRRAEGTRYLYSLDLDCWLAHCAELGLDPAKPTIEGATKYRDGIARRVSQIAVRRSLLALCAIYEDATDGETPAATWNPFKKLPRPHGRTAGRTEAISDADALKLIGSAVTAENTVRGRDLAILWLLYETGMRRASIASMRRDDVIVAKITRVRVVLKGGREGEVEVPPRAAVTLEAWLNQSTGRWVFPGRRGGHLHPSVINKIVNRYARAAGLKKIHPHQFRAAFVTAGLDAGVALHDMQAAVHHSSPEMTQRYDRGKRGAGVSAAVAKFREQKR